MPISLAAARSPATPGPSKDSLHPISSVRHRTVDLRTLARSRPLKTASPSLPLNTPGKPASPAAGSPTQKALIVAPAPTLFTQTAAPPVTSTGFEGIAHATSVKENLEPPDPSVGVGPDHVVQVVNELIRITDRSGGPSATSDTSLANFFFNDPFNSDPRVVYDVQHGRWLMSEVGWDCTPDPVRGVSFGHGFLNISRSNGSDPNGPWQATSFEFDDQLPDYPGLGTTTDKVMVGVNVFDMATAQCTTSLAFNTGGLVVMDWAALISSPSTIQAAMFSDVAHPDFRATYRPAIQAPATVAGGYAIFQAWDGAAYHHVGYEAITGTVAGNNLAGTVHDLTLDGVVSGFVDPAPPHQPGSPATIVNAFDGRPTDAIWRNGKFFFVSTYTCTPTGDSSARDCVRVTELNTTATPSLVQDFLIGQTGEDSYMGGVGITANGTLHVVWTRSSATALDFVTTYSAYQRPSDPANSLSAPQVLRAGEATYTGTRWGDYVLLAQDAQDPNALWQADEYASSDATWGTFVSQLNTGTGSSYVPIPPVRVLDTRNGTGLSGAFTANTPRNFAVAGHGGVPSNAVAVTGNLTVTQQTALGFVSLTVSPTATPSTSTLNFPIGDNRANNVTIPLSATGTLSAVYKAASGKTTHLIFDVTGYFLGDTSGATYTPLTPARILDSRAASPVGPYNTPFAANVQREFPVWNQGGVPTTATAITGNLTVTGQTSLGYLTLSNLDTSGPTTSTLNFPVADNRANGVSLALTVTGSLWAIYKGPTGTTANVIFDVTGYYVAGTGGLRFFPLNPGRRLDGRTGINLGLAGPFAANLSRALDVDGHVGVPIGAKTITGNLTVTGQTKPGFAAVTPDPDNNPTTSTLNFPLGDNRANGVTVPLNASGNTSLVYKASSGTTYLLLDITGYFK